MIIALSVLVLLVFSLLVWGYFVYKMIVSETRRYYSENIKSTNRNKVL